MDLRRYVDDLLRQLHLAADQGGEEARALVDRLAPPLESAARLVLLEVLSAAAAEITQELAPGSVEVRLRGLDPEFVVTSPPEEATSDPASAAATAARPGLAEGDEETTARITLRLPEHLKARIEGAAGAERLSVNAWLVRALAAATEPYDRGRRPPRRRPGSGESLTGWAR